MKVLQPMKRMVSKILPKSLWVMENDILKVLQAKKGAASSMAHGPAYYLFVGNLNGFAISSNEAFM